MKDHYDNGKREARLFGAGVALTLLILGIFWFSLRVWFGWSAVGTVNIVICPPGATDMSKCTNKGFYVLKNGMISTRQP